jgi:hypothetical protein
MRWHQPRVVSFETDDCGERAPTSWILRRQLKRNALSRWHTGRCAVRPLSHSRPVPDLDNLRA